jgi:hypothetical protein
VAAPLVNADLLAAISHELERAAHLGCRWWHPVEVRASKQNLYHPSFPSW